MCKHDKTIEKTQLVNPPVSCKPFHIRYYECECGARMTTTKQRRKNRKNYSQAIRKYAIDNSTHGIYF